MPTVKKAERKMTVRECPQCGRDIGVMWNGQIARHLDRIGIKCRGRLQFVVPAEDRRATSYES